MTECQCSISCLKFKLQEKRINGKNTDVTIVSKDKSAFKAHKLVLISTSPYFQKLFSGSSRELAGNEVQVNFDSKTTTIVLDFMYLQDDAYIQLDDLDQGEDLLKASHIFQMPSLMEVCCAEIRKFMTEEHFSRIDSWAEIYQNEHTKTLLKKFLKKFWKKILISDLCLTCNLRQFSLLMEMWKQFNKSHVKRKHVATARYLISQSNVDHGFNNAELESALSQSFHNDEILDVNMVIVKIIDWIKADSEERIQHSAAVFTIIDHPSLQWNFVRTVLKDTFVKANCDLLLQLLYCVMD